MPKINITQISGLCQKKLDKMSLNSIWQINCGGKIGNICGKRKNCKIGMFYQILNLSATY